MIKSIASVGGLTLVSRGFGFVRDIMMAAILGAGPLADAFLVALRLPNHFRAIFAEGAFNAAFVPSYARVLTQNGAHSASLFADRIFTILFVSQMILVSAAVIFTPAVISALAPGFKDDPLRFSLAVELTRITFPYLFLITLVTFFSGMLNTLQRFAVAAAAPILLNVSIIMALALAAFFPTAGHAAAWGVFLGGVLQFLLLTADITRTGLRVRFTAQWRDHEVKRFFTVLLPAIIGSAGVQIALIADTIIATFLPAGSLAALYYADRINQLPVGAIGIAAGTVLLPEMARRVAAGDETGARAAQNRAVEITLFLAMPCVVAFLTVPDIIMRALFARGAFTTTDAAAAGATLAAYGIGLLPFVLMRTMVATFHARGDTTTPVIASLIAVAVNVALKVVLMRPYAQVGLALATAVGAWLNLGLLTLFAARGNLLGFDWRLAKSVLKIGFAAVALALVLILGTPLVTSLVADLSAAREEARLILLMLFGGATYATLLLAMFGRQLWRRFNGKAPR